MKNSSYISLVNDYKNGSSLLAICEKYHIGKIKAKQILADNNVVVNKPSSYRKQRTFVVSDWRIEKYPDIENHHYVAISKSDDFTTADFMNKAGVLTAYIKNLGINIPSLYDRRIYYQETGNYWWEQWFSIVSLENGVTKKCPYCDWETSDIDNRSGAFEQHLKKSHNISKEEYLLSHPEDKEYFALKNCTLNLQMEKDSAKYVTCKICSKKLKRIDWRHLSAHGISFDEYVAKYGDDTVSEDLHNTLSKNIKKVNETMEFHKESKPEKEIKTFLSSLGVKCTKNRKILGGKEIDIFIPSKNIGIEFNGNFYHTEIGGGKDKYYHLNKTKLCEKNGVALIQIFEDEWEYSKDIVLAKIKHALGLDVLLPKIYGRKCNICLIKGDEAKEFLTKYHIQGYTKASVHYGAFCDGLLIGVMSFVQRQRGKWELVRFASNNNYLCCGVGSKIFSTFVRTYNPLEVKSFADRRWTTNVSSNLYTNMGFKLDSYSPPEYRYFNQHLNRIKRFHKFSFRKNILIKKYGKKYGLTEDMTELEMAHKMGSDRIWDCGLIKYVWKNEKAEN